MLARSVIVMCWYPIQSDSQSRIDVFASQFAGTLLCCTCRSASASKSQAQRCHFAIKWLSNTSLRYSFPFACCTKTAWIVTASLQQVGSVCGLDCTSLIPPTGCDVSCPEQTRYI
jgi:hypothetical protein